MPNHTNSHCGFGVADLKFSDGHPLAGYSFAGKIGKKDPDVPLKVRAIFLEDVAGNVAVIIIAELWTASVAIHKEIAARASAIDSRLSEANVIVAGVHTHSAPGRFMGSSLFNVLAQVITKPDVGNDDEEVRETIVRGAIEAIHAARFSSQPALHALVYARVPAVSRNRSLNAFRRNGGDVDTWHLPGFPGEGLGELADETQRYVDARLPVLVFWSEATGDLLGAFATFACHATALSPEQGTYHGDWPAIAATIAGIELDVPVLVGLSGAGDATPLPPDDKTTYDGQNCPRGVGLANFVGESIGKAIINAARTNTIKTPFSLKTYFQRWQPSTNQGVGIASWCIGVPALAGSEESRTFFYDILKIREGTTSGFFPSTDPQNPKEPALGFLQPFIAAFNTLNLAPYHPIHVLQIENYAIATVPGEPTSAVAWHIEQMLKNTPQIKAASVLGYAGDYVGYFTTQAEYKAQHYEGAMTLFGRYQSQHFINVVQELVSTSKADLLATLPPSSSAQKDENGFTDSVARLIVIRTGQHLMVYSRKTDGRLLKEIQVTKNQQQTPELVQLNDGIEDYEGWRTGTLPNSIGKGELWSKEEGEEWVLVNDLAVHLDP
jgi:neutral ceramidase